MTSVWLKPSERTTETGSKRVSRKRQATKGGESRQIIFNSDKLLQAYIFGDGSENKIRFCVDDNVDESAGSNHEVSPWYTIDWIGWKLVSWDMSVDEAGEWIGDGNLNGSLRFDSFQLTF